MVPDREGCALPSIWAVCLLFETRSNKMMRLQVQYLASELWPAIRARLKDDTAELHLYGAYASHAVQQLHDPVSGITFLCVAQRCRCLTVHAGKLMMKMSTALCNFFANQFCSHQHDAEDAALAGRKNIREGPHAVARGIAAVSGGGCPAALRRWAEGQNRGQLGPGPAGD